MNSTDIVSSLKTDGVTLVENVLSDDQCRALLAGIEWGFQNRQGSFPMLRQRTYEWFREHPILMELLEQTRMYGFTTQWVAHDIPAEVGPTEFIIGSHDGKRAYTNEEALSAISFVNHFPKGSLVFYDHRTWHRGTDNDADRPRYLVQNSYALHAIDKVQIRTPQDDGSEVYIPCVDLIETGSDVIRKLLSPL